MRKAAILTLIAVLGCSPLYAQITCQDNSKSRGVSTLAVINQRLEESAAKSYKFANALKVKGLIKDSGKPLIERIANSDCCFPRDLNEANLVGGFGLLLLTAISHSKDELPLKKAYLKKNGKGTALKRIKIINSRMSDENSIIAKVYGTYRTDELYLLPLSVVAKEPTILVDFAKNRSNMNVCELSKPEVDYNLKGLSSNINQKALEEFISREYPGCFD